MRLTRVPPDSRLAFLDLVSPSRLTPRVSVDRRSFITGIGTIILGSAAAACVRESSASTLQPESDSPAAAAGALQMGNDVVREAPATHPTSRVAIVVDDTGVEIKYLERLLSLGVPLTIATIPGSTYGETAAKMVKDARAPSIVHLPMQSKGQKRTKGVVSIGMNQNDVRDILDEAFGVVSTAVGVNNHRGDLATTDEGLMRTVLGDLASRGKWFLDSYTTGGSVAYRVATEQFKMTPRINNVFIDHHDDPAYVEAALAELAAIARVRGSAIGICHATREGTPLGLKNGLGKLIQSGVEVVPLDQVASRPIPLKEARGGLTIEGTTPRADVSDTTAPGGAAKRR